ncbi:response regulator [Paenibacillus arenilitoris]|uniref:Response regulator n=1 Tax=Paenibacillus arenilitoris TaxID=2772299 RepID=A0A927H496_9BACL|nr:response regulator [Paenibacillus arenilitoris]MBD2868156.1 response regulator [Paenibacillus arenilitoris]
MNAILVDDEKPALLHLERMLAEEGRLAVAGKFTTAREALEHVSKTATDFVFLDIGMPEMNGLEAANYFLQIDPRIRIVYVTAFSEYAIEAFELNALDYLLKPVSPARLAKTVERIAEYAGMTAAARQEPDEPGREAAILAFRRLDFRGGGQSGARLKWRTAKAQELFAYMLHQKGKWIDKDVILDLLWPDYPPDKATTHLHTSVYQIRKLLKEWEIDAAVEYAQEGYRLNADHLTTDVELFEQGLAEPHKAGGRRQPYADVLRLYAGPYLEEHDYAWAKPRREQLRQKYVDFVLAAAQTEAAAGRHANAVPLLLDAQEKDPYSEVICRKLMTVYADLRDDNALQSCYASFCRLIEQELGIEPEPRTKQTYELLLRSSRG